MKVTLRRALTVWLVRQRVGKAITTRRYHREIVKMIRRHLRDRLSKAVADFNEDDLTVFAMRAGHYSASRWNGMLTVLHSTIPAGRSLRRRELKLSRPPPPTQRQFQSLLRECDQATRSHVGLVVDFLAHTGLRITAARGVKWLDVHEDRIDYISKGGRLCSVPIINGLRATLDRLQGVHDGSGYVLPRGAIKTALGSACKRAGLRRLNHHDFRHLFITRCIESGVDVPTVARWVGHKDGGRLLSQRYFHLMDAHSRAMAEKVRI